MRWTRLRGRAGADGGPRRRLPARRPRRGRRRRCAPCEREGLWRFGEGFSEVYERAVLRRRLRVERQELRRIASWADGRSAELSDGAIDLARDRRLADGEEGGRPPAARSALHELLTPREIDVLEHLVKGETNAEIARTLIVSEGTVKFHVKNILRKMNVGQPGRGDVALSAPLLRQSLRGAEGGRPGDAG